MKRKHYYILNALLIVAIGVVLFLTLHNKNVSINVTINSQSKELNELIKRHLPDLPEKELTFLFVFNNLPTKPKVEELQKLHTRFNEKVNIVAFFNKAFKVEQQISFPHVFPGNVRIALPTNKGAKVPERFFMILKENKVDYFDFNSSLMATAFLIQKRINPEREYKDYAVSIEGLKQKIAGRIKRGNLNLLRLNGEAGENAADFTGISKVYFVHAACSACQLKSILKSMKLKEILDRDKSVVIFSILANSFELAELLEKAPIDIPFYLDSNDEFGLFSVITDDRKNPIEIDLAENTKPETVTP